MFYIVFLLFTTWINCNQLSITHLGLEPMRSFIRKQTYEIDLGECLITLSNQEHTDAA